MNFTRESQGLISTPARELTPISRSASPFRPGGGTAFTLLEVMIAMGIFFMAIFAILALVSTNLRNARLLQKPSVDAGMLIAELCQTNKLVEGIETGDFGDVYPGYRWTREINQVMTNGLFQVDFVVSPPAHSARTDVHMSVLLWRPDSAAGKGFGTTK